MHVQNNKDLKSRNVAHRYAWVRIPSTPEMMTPATSGRQEIEFEVNGKGVFQVRLSVVQQLLD